MRIRSDVMSWRWIRTGVCAALGALPLICGPAAAGSVRVYAGGGWYVPTDSGVREAYDGGLSLTAGLGVPVYLERTWFTLEASYLENSGQEFAYDPTFDPGGSRYWLLPLCVGLRFDITPQDTRHNAVLVGLQVLTVPTGFEDDIRGDESGTTLGAAAELRGEFPAGSRWLGWIRSRWIWTADVEYELISPLPVDGVTLELGIARRLGRDPEEGGSR